MMKELVLEVTSKLPNNATIEEILDAILVRLAIHKRYWRRKCNFSRRIVKGYWNMVIKWTEFAKTNLKDFSKKNTHDTRKLKKLYKISCVICWVFI